jgi:inorganic pyrophosphatase
MNLSPIEQLAPVARKGAGFNAIVETPKGSQVKYAYDKETGLMRLSKILPAGMVFPYNFGFFPSTLAADGDALDVLILNDEVLTAGCLLTVQPVAVIEATQTENGRPVRNDRIVGQAVSHEAPLEVRKLKLDPVVASQIAQFFAAYNKLYDKKFKLLGVGGPKRARQLIDQAAARFQKSNQ